MGAGHRGRDRNLSRTGTPFEQFLEKLRRELPGVGDIRRTFRERPTTFRVNTLRADVPSVEVACQRAGIKLKRVSWSTSAFIVPANSKREVEALDVYERGEIYLQSLASQMPPLVLSPRAGERVLDLCAAPGGKTAQMAAMMCGEGELVAVEKDKIRAERLAFNLERQGVMEQPKLAVKVVMGDALKVDVGEEKFDRILIDAPCSGEARFVESDRETWRHWSEEFVTELSVLQRALLRRAVGLLKPGGTMVYSTCTFSVAENELVVAEGLRQGLSAKAWPLAHIPTFPAAVLLGGRTQLIGARLRPTPDLESFFISPLQSPSVVPPNTVLS